MKPITRELKREVREAREPLRLVRMQTEHFQTALSLAITCLSADDDTILETCFKAILRASQAGQPVIIGD